MKNSRFDLYHHRDIRHEIVVYTEEKKEKGQGFTRVGETLS